MPYSVQVVLSVCMAAEVINIQGTETINVSIDKANLRFLTKNQMKHNRYF